jgi:hypothetical protein
MALLLCAVAVGLYLLGGPSGFDRLGLTLPQILLVYLLGGFIAGGLTGLLRSYATSWPTAMLVGMLVTFPVCVCAYTFKFGPVWRWGGTAWLTTGLATALFGAMGAKLFFDPRKNSSDS